MSSHTTFLSKLIGLYYIFAALSMITHKEATVAAVEALIHNPPMLFIVGIITLATGLAMILGHNLWSGGAATLLVTLVGWLTLVKGLLVLFLSPEAGVRFWGALRYEQLFYVYATISLTLGVYLTYHGFKPRRIRQDLPERRSLAA